MYRIPTRATAGVAALALIVSGALAACGDDGDSASADTPPTSAPAAGDAGDAASLPVEACDAFVALSAAFVGDPTGAGADADALVESAPSDLTEPAETIAAAFASAATDESALGSPEFTAAWAAIGDAAFDSCETDESLEVRGIDYAFSGLAAELPAGRVGIRFTNDSQAGEPHELVLVRRLPGADAPVNELLALPPDQLFSQVEMAGVVFVDQAPNRAAALLELDAGEYIAVCTLPTAGDDTDPHAAHGMVAEFEVVS